MTRHKKPVSLVLSMLLPGAGHLYIERYTTGTVGVVLAAWALLFLLISVFVFTPDQGFGERIFSISLYTYIGLWIFMLISAGLEGVNLAGGRIDRIPAFHKAYEHYLKKQYGESEELFARLYAADRSDQAAGIMLARSRIRLGQYRKARTVLKRLLRTAEGSSWEWEIRSCMAEHKEALPPLS
jgi:hypothetical protein